MPSGSPLCRVAGNIKLQIRHPFVRRLNRRELQPEIVLVNAEHAFQYFLVREKYPQRFGVDEVAGLLDLVVVITPVPGVNDHRRRYGNGDPFVSNCGQGCSVQLVVCFEGLHLGHLGGELRLGPGNEIVNELFRRRAGPGHLDLGLVVVPGFVAEGERDVVAQREDAVEQRDVVVLGDAVAGNVEFFAGRFAVGVLLHQHVLKRLVGHDRVLIRPGLDLGRIQKFRRHAVEFGAGERHGRDGVDDVRGEIGRERAEFLAHGFDLPPLLGRQSQPGAVVVAHGLCEQARLLAGKLRLQLRVSGDRFVNVLAVVDGHAPIVDLFRGDLGGLAQGGVGAGLLDEREPLRENGDRVGGVVERADRRGEGHVAEVLLADVVEHLVGGVKRCGDGLLDFSRRVFEGGNGQDGVELGGERLEVGERGCRRIDGMDGRCGPDQQDDRQETAAKGDSHQDQEGKPSVHRSGGTVRL